jgi:hypothetical protein
MYQVMQDFFDQHYTQLFPHTYEKVITRFSLLIDRKV